MTADRCGRAVGDPPRPCIFRAAHAGTCLAGPDRPVIPAPRSAVDPKPAKETNQ